MDTLKQFATRTRVEGLVILLVAVGYMWEANNVPEFYQLPGIPGPTTFPYLLGVVFALCGLWFLVSPQDLMARFTGARDGDSAPAGADPARAAPVDVAPVAGGGLLRRLASDWHFYAMWLIVLAYLWLMPDLGFPLATFLLLAGFTYLLGETRWRVYLGLAFVATAVIYAGFKFGLNVRLPLGILETLFK